MKNHDLSQTYKKDAMNWGVSAHKVYLMAPPDTQILHTFLQHSNFQHYVGHS